MFTHGDIDKVMAEGEFLTDEPVDWNMAPDVLYAAQNAGVLPREITLLRHEEGFWVRLDLSCGLRLCSLHMDAKEWQPERNLSVRDQVMHILYQAGTTARGLASDWFRATSTYAGVELL